jgi:hypothetical protein
MAQESRYVALRDAGKKAFRGAARELQRAVRHGKRRFVQAACENFRGLAAWRNHAQERV